MCLKASKKGIFFGKYPKMTAKSCDLLSDNKKLFRVTTGKNPESLNTLYASIPKLQGGVRRGQGVHTGVRMGPAIYSC